MVHAKHARSENTLILLFSSHQILFLKTKKNVKNDSFHQHTCPPSRPERKARSHGLRYVLKNRATDTVYFVVVFTLYLKEDVDKEGNIKEGVVGGVPNGGLEALEAKESKDEEEKKPLDGGNTNDDDVD